MDIQTKNIKTVIVDGDEYEVDLNDLKVVNKINEFTEKLSTGKMSMDDLIKESKSVIDAAFGKGLCNLIFKNDSLAVYYVALEIKRIYQEEFISMQEQLQPSFLDKEKQSLIEYTGILKDFNKEMDYAHGKYMDEEN